MDSDEPKCSICGDPAGLKTDGTPRQCCQRCRPGGPNFKQGDVPRSRTFDLERASTLQAAGKSFTEIAAELGCSRQNVHRALKSAAERAAAATP